MPQALLSQLPRIPASKLLLLNSSRSASPAQLMSLALLPCPQGIKSALSSLLPSMFPNVGGVFVGLFVFNLVPVCLFT